MEKGGQNKCCNFFLLLRVSVVWGMGLTWPAPLYGSLCTNGCCGLAQSSLPLDLAHIYVDGCWPDLPSAPVLTPHQWELGPRQESFVLPYQPRILVHANFACQQVLQPSLIKPALSSGTYWWVILPNPILHPFQLSLADATPCPLPDPGLM